MRPKGYKTVDEIRAQSPLATITLTARDETPAAIDEIRTALDELIESWRLPILNAQFEEKVKEELNDNPEWCLWWDWLWHNVEGERWGSYVHILDEIKAEHYADREQYREAFLNLAGDDL